MSNKDVTESEADVKVVNDLGLLKDHQYYQMKVVSELQQHKDTYYQTDIW